MKINQITLGGYKSVHPDGQKIPFGDITVFIGANGMGKSNLISFFTMLNYMTTDGLQRYVAEQGYATTLLYHGPKQTPALNAEIVLSDDCAEDIYKFVLTHASGDLLIFTDEAISWKYIGREQSQNINLGVGHREANLPRKANEGDRTSQFVFYLLKSCRVFHFHDTSVTAKIRNQGYIEDNRYLRSDGGNLAAFLYAMQKSEEGKKYYNRIVHHIQDMIPNFEKFDLSPSMNENYIMLNWKERNSDYRFGPHQISDGGLRYMALATLFLQPPVSQPKVIILDEPELGLHPSALNSLAGMIRSASQHAQIILATQSTRLLDEFDPEQIVVVERDERTHSSIFKRLSESELSEWLENYSLSDLWEKNVIGGRP